MAEAAETRLFPGYSVGQRTTENWTELFGGLQARFDPDALPPLFTSDNWDAIQDGLLEVFGVEVERPYAGRGRYPEPRRVPPENLRYAQVVKHRENGHLVSVERRIVWGDPHQIARDLHGQKINTSLVERQNLTIRQSIRRFTRKSLGFSKELELLDCHLALFQAYQNFLRPHHSLRKRKRGRYPRYTKRTPAMAQGLTDHIWTWREFLRWRKPLSMER